MNYRLPSLTELSEKGKIKRFCLFQSLYFQHCGLEPGAGLQGSTAGGGPAAQSPGQRPVCLGPLPVPCFHLAV